MRCPTCNSRAIRNGSGRARCLGTEADHGTEKPRTFNITAAIEQQDIEETAQARRAWAPDYGLEHPVAPGQRLRGASSLINKRTGETVLQWVKSAEDPLLQQAVMDAAIAAFAEKIPRAKPRKAPLSVAVDLANQYTITDYHLGMLAWGEETGADWDLDIAENMLVRFFEVAIAQSPDAALGILAQLGDFLHWDGFDAVTPTSKHLLDADTRFPKLIRVAIRALRRVIGMLLDKHERVVILCAEGNHDLAGSAWLRESLAALYEHEPRVEVITRPDPYYCIEHGEVGLFYHHGHKRKPEQVDAVLVAKFREVYGRTKFHYAHTGHMHHKFAKETTLMVVEQHRTLAAPDAHASRGGWMSGRDASVITYHKARGEVGRVVVNSAMLDAPAAA
jgi:hypothetical protein